MSRFGPDEFPQKGAVAIATLKSVWEQTLKRITKHLNDVEVPCTCDTFAPPSEEAMEALEQRNKITIPPVLKEAFLTIGDGMIFSWKFRYGTAMGSIPLYRSGGLDLPSLKDFLSMSRTWSLLCDCHQDNPEAADRTPELRSLAPLITWGNGDRFLIETQGRNPGRIVFYYSAPPDGEIDQSLRPVANSLAQLIEDWGGVCFFHPNWWPETFKGDSGINWKSSEFPRNFRVPNASPQGRRRHAH